MCATAQAGRASVIDLNLFWDSLRQAQISYARAYCLRGCAICIHTISEKELTLLERLYP